MGPMNYVYHLLSTPRLPFTAAYFGSIAMTLIFAIKVSTEFLQTLSHTRLQYSMLTRAATKHAAYTIFGSCPDRGASLVSRKLFPYGSNRSAHGHDFWSQTGDLLDVGLVADHKWLRSSL